MQCVCWVSVSLLSGIGGEAFREFGEFLEIEIGRSGRVRTEQRREPGQGAEQQATRRLLRTPHLLGDFSVVEADDPVQEDDALVIRRQLEEGALHPFQLLASGGDARRAERRVGDGDLLQ